MKNTYIYKKNVSADGMPFFVVSIASIGRNFGIVDKDDKKNKKF